MTWKTNGPRIDQVWNGALTQGDPLVVRNVAWNGALAANGTATFGFLGNGTPATPTLTCTAG